MRPLASTPSKICKERVFSQVATFLPFLLVFQGFLPLLAHSLRIPWEKRFQEHLRDRGNTPKCRWLAELKQDGLYPKLEILEIVKGFYGAFSREDYWIKEMLAAGAPLTNFIPMQGVFTKQKAAISTPYSWRGTKLRTVRKRLKVTKDKVADLAGVSTSAYNRAEGGFPVNYDVAMDILQAINSLLVEYGQSEVSIEDLDWMTE